MSETLPSGSASFAAVLPADTYTVYGEVSSSTAPYTGTLGDDGESGQSFTVNNNTITTYTALKRVVAPTFWQAHFSSFGKGSSTAGTYSVTLNSEVDRTTAQSYEIGSETVTKVGFKALYRYEILTYDNDGGVTYTINDNGTLTVGGETTIGDREALYSTDNDKYTYVDSDFSYSTVNSSDNTFSCTVDGLEEGFIYVFTPYATTSVDTYDANRVDDFSSDTTTGTYVYKGLSEADTVTGTTNASIAVSVTDQTWPETISMTYGDKLESISITDSSNDLDSDGYITYSNADGELTTSVNILHDSSLYGTFSFEIYTDEDMTTEVDDDNYTSDYLNADTYFVKMTFTPADDSYSASFNTVSSEDAIELTVNPMPVTVKTNGDTLSENSTTSYLKVYDGIATFTLNDDDINLVGLRESSTGEYKEDSSLTTLANGAIVDGETVTATAKSGSSSVSDANTLYDNSALISNKNVYTLTVTNLGDLVDSSNYEFVSTGTTYTDASGNSADSTLYGWIAQRKVTATVQINARTSSTEYGDTDGTVETGQYFYITVDAGTVSGAESSTGLVDGETTVSEFSNLSFDLTSSKNNGVTDLTYGSEGKTRLLYVEDSVAISSANTLSNVFTGNYYPVDSYGTALKEITGSVKVEQVTPTLTTHYTVNGNLSNGYYTTEVEYAATETGGYTSATVNTSNTSVTEVGSFPSSGKTAIVEESGTYYLQLFNNDTGAFTAVLPLGKLTVDTGTPEVKNVSLSPENTGSAAKTINKLTFGIFFNEAIKVTVTGFAGDSGLYSLVYNLGDGNGEKTITGWVDSGESDGKGTITFTVPLNNITDTNTGEVYFYITNNAGTQSVKYTISSDATDEDGVTTVEADGMTIVVAESDAPTVTYSVTGSNGTQLNESNTSGWFTGAATLIATIADNLQTNSSVESGIASYEVAITAYDSNGDIVNSASSTTTISTIQSSGDDNGKAFTAVQTYLDKYTATVSETTGVYYFEYTITAYDHAGNDSGAQTHKVYVDSTAPTLTGTVKATDASNSVTTTDIANNNTSTSGETEYYTINTYTNQAIIVSLSSYDATSGVSSITVTKDGTAADAPTTDTTSNGTVTYNDYSITSCGVYVFTVTDAAENSTIKTINVTGYDEAEPTVSVGYGDYTPGDWSADPVNVNVTFTDTETDASTASGFAYLTYSYTLGDATVATESGNLTVGSGELTYDEQTGYSFTLSDSGVYNELTVTVYDQAGNYATYTIANDGTYSRKTINIDTATPTLTVSVEKGGTATDTTYTSGETWAQNGETVVYTLTADESVSELTYMVSDNDQTYYTMAAATTSGGILYDVAEWNSTAHTLTFSKSYEGTIYFKVQNESGTYSVISDSGTETCVQKVQISVETFSADIINNNITLNSNAYSSDWYKADSVSISVSPAASQENTASNVNPTPSNTVTTEVTITKYETADTTGDGKTVDTSTLYNYCDYGQDGNNSADAAYTKTLNESGYYVLTVTATDEAGNTATWEKTIKLDVVAPTAGSVTYTDADTGSTSDGLRGLIRKLSFGLFYNKAVDVTVTFTDDLSGIGTKAIYYEKIAADGTFTGSGTELTVATTEGTEIVYSATIPLTVSDTSGYIRYWAVDEAGNISAYYNLGYDLTDADDTTSTSEVTQILWKLENTAPSISKLSATDGTYTDNSNTAATSSDAATWLTASTGATVSATIEDGGSGLYSVTASYLYVESFDDIAKLEDPTANNLTSTILAGTCYTDDGYGTKVALGEDESATSAVNTAYWKADTELTASGVYKVTISALDNATNKSEDYTLYVYVDATAPVVTVSYDDSTQNWVNNSAANQYITVNFTVTEATSGTASVIVTGTTGTKALKDAGGNAVDSITLNVVSGDSYSFNAYANDTFTITVKDNAGNTNNTSSDTVNLVTVRKIDLVDPVYTTLAVNSDGFTGDFNVSTNYYKSDNITFTITASDTISGLKSYQMYYNTTDSNENGTALTGGSGDWTQTTPGTDDTSVTTGTVTQSGTYYVYVVLTDNAGNTYTSGTTQIRLENDAPSGYLYSYKYNGGTYSASDVYTTNTWVNDDGVVALVESGLGDGKANYYYAVNSTASSGEDVTEWTKIEFVDNSYTCEYGLCEKFSVKTDLL